MILGHSHFIKTIEDLYEVMAESAPSLKFGIAFCKAGGPCLSRYEGNDEALTRRLSAWRNATLRPSAPGTASSSLWNGRWLSGERPERDQGGLVGVPHLLRDRDPA